MGSVDGLVFNSNGTVWCEMPDHIEKYFLRSNIDNDTVGCYLTTMMMAIYFVVGCNRLYEKARQRTFRITARITADQRLTNHYEPPYKPLSSIFN